jgi:hypothetical protein
MCKLKEVFFFVVFMHCACSVLAQPTVDTIKSCLKQRPHPFIKLDSRNSFISNSRAKITGCKLGVDYAHRLQFGLGFNLLRPSPSYFDKTITYVNSDGFAASAIGALKLWYVSAHTEYAYYKTPQWRLSILLQLGGGKTYYQYLNLVGQKKQDQQSLVFIYEPAISIEYKVIRWLGVGADTGFRFMVTNYNNVNQKFNSPTYAFKLLIYYNEIYKYALGKLKEHKT